MNCCICGVELTGENTSIEHIIPNAIGGRLTSKNIFCKQCNSNFGTAIDSNFVKIFQPIQDFVKIDRDTYESSFFCKDIEAGYWHYKYLMLARLMWRLRGQAESFCKAVADNDYTGNGNAFDYNAKNDSKIIYEEEK